MRSFAFIILFLLISTSCHWLLPADRPARLINLHEQLSIDAKGYLDDLRDIEHSRLIVLASAPPSGFLRPGAFEKYLENENFLFQFQHQFQHRDRQVRLVCTIDPKKRVELLLRDLTLCFDKGAIGAKIYHTHTLIQQKDFGGEDPMSLPDMSQVLELLQSRGKALFLLSNQFDKQNELFAMIQKYPKVPVLCSNMCFAGERLGQLDQLMQATPNLFLGYSFLFPKIFYQFLQKNDLKRVQQFFIKYQDRLFYESSYLLDKNELIAKRYMQWSFKNKYHFLKDKVFTFYSPPIINQARNFTGLNLSEEILDKIYYQNAKDLLDRLSNSR